jgi:hypothetical protein
MNFIGVDLGPYTGLIDFPKKVSMVFLKDRSKSGRTPEIPEELANRITKELLESKQQGWTTKNK